MRQAEFVRVTRASVLILLGLAAHPGNVSDIDLHDVLGEPAVGRRFKGQIWLQGNVKFNK